MKMGSMVRRGSGALALLVVVGVACGQAANGAQEGAVQEPAVQEPAAQGGGSGGASSARAGSPGSPQRVPLNKLGFDRGRPDAPVLVLEFSDFGCPYCSRFALQTLPQIDSEFIAKGTVRWKYVPFVMGMFPNGGEAARAAECAADQDRSQFWRMHDKLYGNQREWRGTTDPETLFLGYAKSLGLDEKAFAACYGSDHVKNLIAANNEMAARLGVQATPTFFVNGVRIQGALPIEQFRLFLRGAAAGGN
jgi:protein-disulfide isomerase